MCVCGGDSLQEDDTIERVRKREMKGKKREEGRMRRLGETKERRD